MKPVSSYDTRTKCTPFPSTTNLHRSSSVWNAAYNRFERTVNYTKISFSSFLNIKIKNNLIFKYFSFASQRNLGLKPQVFFCFLTDICESHLSLRFVMNWFQNWAVLHGEYSTACYSDVLSVHSHFENHKVIAFSMTLCCYFVFNFTVRSEKTLNDLLSCVPFFKNGASFFETMLARLSEKKTDLYLHVKELAALFVSENKFKPFRLAADIYTA